MVDLTSFGFTTTESRVYTALLELGPSSGYAVGRATRLARANAYGALDGLVTKGAATRTSGRPARYRATDPDALMARLAATQGEALERLGEALGRLGRRGEPETRAVTGVRALATLVVNVVARAEHSVQGILPPELLRQTLPAWRRAAERATIGVSVAGAVPEEARSLGFASSAPGERAVLLVDDRQAITAEMGSAQGIWSSHPALVSLARTVIERS
ncbi:MAG TPA: helix-turn-helix domain-containing protein [Gemmatimonadales bacterium]|nr:helix-turn-helix domain-containing protein [Gemmatimonadales bacterium]